MQDEMRDPEAQNALWITLAGLVQRLEQLEARYISHEETLSRLAIRAGDLESQVKDLENRLDRLADDVHHGGDD